MMNDSDIDARHRALRGTDRLLYYPPEQACKSLCGYLDNDSYSDYYEIPHHLTDHQCYLVPGHAGPCVFSSQCIKPKLEVTDGGLEKVAGITDR